MPVSSLSKKLEKEKMNGMSILLIDVSRKIKACRFARTLGSSERLTEQLIMLKEYADRHRIVVTDTILYYNGGSEIDRIKIEELYEGVEIGRYGAVLVTALRLYSIRIKLDMYWQEHRCNNANIGIVNVNRLYPFPILLHTLMDYDFIHESIKDFWCQFVNADVPLCDRISFATLVASVLASLSGQGFYFLL